MIFEHIEKLKKQYTDKYVVVDESRPELQRFRGQTGAVKTVNMSGRALVEFDGFNNIGWYDIDPAFLKLVDAPPPKPVESKKDKAAAPKVDSPKASAAGAKPVGEKKLPAPAAAAKPAAAGKSVAEILAAARKPATAAAAAPAAEAKPAAVAAAKVAPGGKGMSMADILAAARGNKPAGAAPAAKAEAPAAAKQAPPKAAPAAPKAAPAAKPVAGAPAKVAPGGKGMSVEQIMALARGNKPAAKATADSAAPPVEEAAQESPPTAEVPVAEEAAPAPAVAPAASSGGVKSLKDQITSVAEQIAYCRKVDSK
jgi:hypothetical protein